MEKPIYDADLAKSTKMSETRAEIDEYNRKVVEHNNGVSGHFVTEEVSCGAIPTPMPEPDLSSQMLQIVIDAETAANLSFYQLVDAQREANNLIRDRIFRLQKVCYQFDASFQQLNTHSIDNETSLSPGNLDIKSHYKALLKEQAELLDALSMIMNFLTFNAGM